MANKNKRRGSRVARDSGHTQTGRPLSWGDSLSTGEAHAFTKSVATYFANEVFCEEHRKRLNYCISNNRFSDLCNYDLAYDGLSTLDAINIRQALALYQKRADLDLGIDRRSAAKTAFMRSEELCMKTNHIFRSWSRGNLQFTPRVEAVLHQAQRKISNILGDAPSFSALKLRFGPGATTLRKKRNASPRGKLGDPLACSENLIPLLPELLAEMPLLALLHSDADYSADEESELLCSCSVHILRARLDFVRKSAKTDRAIVVENPLNTMLQLGIGDYMAKRLRTAGVDIRDQTLNQRLARHGSVTGDLATLDLSSASDTVATELVRHLLPDDWFELLNCARSTELEYEGELIRLQKFSSMGNGFTFPLETLIFYALAAAATECVGKTDYLVNSYGDDIIVPSVAVPRVTEVLHACGFILNKDKSFAEGPFRESCGADYLSGTDIRPFYLRDLPTIADLYSFHNFLVEKNGAGCESADIILSFIPSASRIWGPAGYGDGHLVDPFWSANVARRSCQMDRTEKTWYGGYLFDTFTWKSRRSFAVHPGDRVLPVYSIYASGAYAPEPYDGPYDQDLSRLLEPSTSAFSYDKRQRLGVVLPGNEGYKRISIYTLG